MKMMKFLAACFVFILLAASISLADGLAITEIDVDVDYDEAYTYRVENRDRISSTSVSVANNSKIGADILPGANVTFTVRVENTFPSGGPDLKGVFTRMTIEEIDDGSDIEETSLDFDLEPGDDYRFETKFRIPLDVDAGTYNTLLEAEGEDRNGTDYKTKLNLKLEVKKQNHDIRITRPSLIPEIAECSRKIRLSADIMNVGSNLENQNALEFKSAAFGINSVDKDISLESSDEASEESKTYTKTLGFEVPSFFKPGRYPILVNLYWKNFVLFDQKTVDLFVKDCGTKTTPTKAAETEEKKPQTQDSDNLAQQKTEAEGSEQGFQPNKPSFVVSPTLVFLLLGGFAIIAMVSAIVIGYSKRRKQ